MHCGQDSVMLWGKLYWPTLGLGSLVDLCLICAINLNQVRPFMVMAFPSGTGLFQQCNELCHTAHAVRKWFEETRVLPWPPYSQDLIPIKHFWDVLVLLMSCCQRPQGVLRGLTESISWQSELFWQYTQKKMLIRQVLISVHPHVLIHTNLHKH